MSDTEMPPPKDRKLPARTGNAPPEALPVANDRFVPIAHSGMPPPVDLMEELLRESLNLDNPLGKRSCVKLKALSMCKTHKGSVSPLLRVCQTL